jgi:hypothetical protein
MRTLTTIAATLGVMGARWRTEPPGNLSERKQAQRRRNSWRKSLIDIGSPSGRASLERSRVIVAALSLLRLNRCL